MGSRRIGSRNGGGRSRLADDTTASRPRSLAWRSVRLTLVYAGPQGAPPGLGERRAPSPRLPCDRLPLRVPPMRVEVDGSDVPERHLAVVRALSDSPTRHPCDGVVHGTPGGGHVRRRPPRPKPTALGAPQELGRAPGGRAPITMTEAEPPAVFGVNASSQLDAVRAEWLWATLMSTPISSRHKVGALTCGPYSVPAWTASSHWRDRPTSNVGCPSGTPATRRRRCRGPRSAILSVCLPLRTS